jgi:hypothetical protein
LQCLEPQSASLPQLAPSLQVGEQAGTWHKPAVQTTGAAQSAFEAQVALQAAAPQV